MSYHDIQIHKRRVDQTFGRAKALQPGDPIQGDLTKHLCVQVFGYLEQTVKRLLVIHAQTRGTPRTIERYVESQLSRFRNPDTDRLLDLLGSLDPGFRDDLETRMTQPQIVGVNSVVGLRHSIAHGGPSTTSLGQLEQYYDRVDEVLGHLTQILR